MSEISDIKADVENYISKFNKNKDSFIEVKNNKNKANKKKKKIKAKK